MKKTLFLIYISLFAFLFYSCSDLSVSEETSVSYSVSSQSSSCSNAVQTRSSSAAWTYDEDYPVFEIGSSVGSVSITGDIGGKTVYLVMANKSSSAVSVSSSSTARYIADFSTDTAEDESESDSSQTVTEIETGSTLITPDDAFPYFTNFIPPEDVQSQIAALLKNRSSSMRSASALPDAVSQITPVVDETTKDIYVDCDTSISTFTQKTATLRAVGDYCYVWVVDDYYTSGTDSGKQVSSSTAESFAEMFDKIYPMITNVFGEESDNLLYSSGGTALSMDSYSDTGTMVNIVIYDIGADYESSSSSGIVGYFYAKDYFYPASTVSSSSIYSKSNKGKYFYVDSAYAVSYFNMVISTLAHEFQHMVNFNQKYVLQSLSSSSNFNEMLSMICEDMMQKQLGISDKYSPKARLQGFNAYYYYSGLCQYSSSYTTVSYADSYALGAWLCRQYGGAELAKAMSTNAYVDNASIAAAVNKVNGTNYTFDDLFEQFLLAVTGSSTYTMNQAALESLSYGEGDDEYTYPMSALDFWDEDFSVTSVGLSNYSSVQKSMSSYAYSSYDWTGPFLFSKSTGLSSLPANYGFTLHGLGETGSSITSGTITIGSLSTSLSLYLIIQ